MPRTNLNLLSFINACNTSYNKDIVLELFLKWFLIKLYCGDHQRYRDEPQFSWTKEEGPIYNQKLFYSNLLVLKSLNNMSALEITKYI